MIFRKRKEEPKGEQSERLVVDWGIERHREAMLQSRLFDTAAQLTAIRFAPGTGTEEAIVDSFGRTFELLQDWYKGTPQKMEIKAILDKLYPDPLGYEPGETLLPKTQDFPERIGTYFEEKGWRLKD